MSESLVVSLVIAAVSGLTFLAYKHPVAYKRLYLPIFAILSVAVFVAISWNAAIAFTLASLKEFIPTEHAAAAAVKAHELDVPYSLTGGAYFISLAYLAFLLWLPDILHENKGRAGLSSADKEQP